MKIKDTTIIILLLGVFLAITYFFESRYYLNLKYNIVCEQTINGNLKSCNEDRSGTTFKLLNDDNFWFNPFKNIKENKSFCLLAKKGDKIIKAEGDSIFFLIKSNRDTFRFNFYCP